MTNPYHNQYPEFFNRYTNAPPYPIKYKSISPQHHVDFFTKLPEKLKFHSNSTLHVINQKPLATDSIYKFHTIPTQNPIPFNTFPPQDQVYFFTRLPEKFQLSTKPSGQSQQLFTGSPQKPYQLIGLEQFRPVTSLYEKDVEQTTPQPDHIQQYAITEKPSIVSSKIDFNRKKR